MICDTCRLSVRHILAMDDYKDTCAVADDPIARLDGSIGTEGCAGCSRSVLVIRLRDDNNRRS